MNKNLGNIIRLIVFLSIGSAILYFVYKEQSAQYISYCTGQGNAREDCNLISKIISDIKSADIIWIILTIITYLLSNVSRAIRWKLLINSDSENVRTGNAFFATMIGYLANLAIPRLGEFVRAGVISRYEKIDSAKVMGTVVTDRLLDLLCFGIAFGLGLVLASGQIIGYINENASMPSISTSFFLGMSAGLILLCIVVGLLFIKFKEHNIVKKVVEKIRQFVAGILSIRKVKNLGGLIFHSINIWVMYYLMTFLPFYSFEATSELGPVAGLLVFIFGGLGMILPAPGGIGTYHAMVIAGLSIYGISGPDAFSFAMIIFIAINILVNLLMGLLSLIILPLYNKNYKSVNAEIPE
ncbi:lysylphosphatidylglycerol synthase transmembrane domain-containing protein [Membranihabitans maritimus]|uniref:lysylphosphatidylglycerol synthase transmembrane domain-containing protein n=1 Tax=Membranihabitans maritimus TaxID=2904244 RepID=UPI001F329B99|nr:lysylphosphatidylglycerol synthase transmembrane domain-containing protein [Membranihabitans maritimus]